MRDAAYGSAASSASPESANTPGDVALLLQCARTDLGADGAERITFLARQDIDWKRFLQQAHRHRVIPLVFGSLTRACADGVPQEVLDELTHRCDAVAHYNLVLAEELVTLVDVFDAHGITAVPFKGPILAASVYGDLALRECGDLDILVQRNDVFDVQEVLRSRGYEVHRPITGAPHLAYRQSTYYPFMRVVGADRIRIDLQWRMIEGPFSFDLDRACSWHRLKAVCLAGTTVRALSTEDLLLILCVHGAKHSWRRLMWICDIAEILRSDEDIDWGGLAERARRLGSRRMLALGLSLAERLLGASVPVDAWKVISADSAVRSLTARVYARMLLGDGPTDGRDTASFYLHLRERLKDRLQYSIYLARDGTHRERWFLPLPALVSCLYSLLRPIWGVGKHGVRTVRRLRSAK